LLSGSKAEQAEKLKSGEAENWKSEMLKSEMSGFSFQDFSFGYSASAAAGYFVICIW
jgi:hypothetical protein